MFNNNHRSKVTYVIHSSTGEDNIEKMLNENTEKVMESILLSKQEEMAQGSSMQHERALKSLEMVKEFVHQSFNSQGVIANSVVQNGQEPYLNIMVVKSDPYLLDYGCVRINCFVDADMRIVVVKLSWNRQILEEIVCDDFKTDLYNIINEDLLCDKTYTPCRGFSDQDTSGIFDVFSRLRKNDIPFLLLEKYNGSILYRSRNCRFVIDQRRNDENVRESSRDHMTIFNNQCEQCISFYTQIDLKYALGRFTKPKNKIVGIKREVRNSSQDLSESSLHVSTEQDEDDDTVLEDRAKSTADNNTSSKPSNEKRYSREGRSRKNDTRYKDFVVELGETEELGLQENTTSTTDDTNEDIENIENLPLNGRNQEISQVQTGNNENSTEDDIKDDKDYEIELDTSRRKGLRKRRLITKKHKSYLELNRKKGRGRGRPPIDLPPVACEQCGKSFTLLKHYKRHCLEHKNAFACSFEDCDRRFKSQKELDIHTRKHRGEKPYVCGECGKAYQEAQDMRLHMRKHTGVKPYKCEMCDKRFARDQQRRVHQVVHTGDKSHLCCECGQSFGSASTLIDHKKRKHLFMREHQCQKCSKGFFTRQELEAHVRVHTGDKPYQCPDCGKCFARSHHLKRHINCIHKGMKADSRNIQASLDTLSMEKSNSDEMTVIVDTNQTMVPSSNVVTLHNQDKRMGTISRPTESDLSDSETVFVTTEDDGAGGTVTFVQNIKGQNISKEENVVQTEYVIEDHLPNTMSETDNESIPQEKGKIVVPISSHLNYKSSQQPKLIQYATLTGASSLLQLAQVGTSLNKASLGAVAASTSIPKSGIHEVTSKKQFIKEDDENTETIFISQDQTVEIPGQNVTYVLITTAENEQQLVPVSKITPDSAR